MKDRILSPFVCFVLFYGIRLLRWICDNRTAVPFHKKPERYIIAFVTHATNLPSAEKCRQSHIYPPLDIKTFRLQPAVLNLQMEFLLA